MIVERPIGSEEAWARVPSHATHEVMDCLASLHEAIADRARLSEDALVRVLGASTTARGAIRSRPELLDWLAPLAGPRDREGWAAALAEALDSLREPETVGRVLRETREALEVVTLARQLMDGDVVAVGRELSDFADAALSAVLAFCEATTQAQYGQPLGRDGSRCPYTLLALDKLGGREMNLRPRLSLMLVYGADGGRTDGAGGLGERVPIAEYFSRLLAEVVSLLEDYGIYEVDLSRIPERGGGALAKSVEELEAYYAQQGHAWHRLAWVRARRVTGDAALGDALMEAIRPFVYPRAVAPALLDSLAAVKSRIGDRAARLAQRDGFDVKLGRGGIRQLEFTVQAMQLLWGGEHPSLRAASTVAALSRLVEDGPLEAKEAEDLKDAWCFLRHLEHCAQAAGYQLQADRGRARWLPGERVSREAIARISGYAPTPDGLEAFEEALAHHRQAVVAAFDALLATEVMGDAEQFGACFEALVGAEDVDEAVVEEALVALGLKAPKLAVGRLVGMSRAPEGPFHPRWLAREPETARRILSDLADLPDPDGALAHLESMVRRFGQDRTFFEALAGDPARMQALLMVFGTSATLSRFLLGDWRSLRQLAHEGIGEPVRSRAEMVREVGERSREGEDGFTGLRLFVRSELIRIGLHDLIGVLDTASVGGQLADLVDAVVGRVVALTDATDEEGGAAIEVLAFGRWAVRELGYGDSVSTLVIHEDDLPSSRRARHVVGALEEVLAQGHLLHLTPVAWSDGRHRGFVVPAAGLAGGEGAPSPLGLASARTIVGPGVTGRTDAPVASPEIPAYGDEGVAHIEEAVRLLADAPIDGSVVGALARLAEEGRVTAAEASRAAEVHAFLRRLENRAAIVHDNPGWLMGHLLEPDPDTRLRAVRRHLARCAGYAEGTEGGPDAALLNDVRRCRADAKNLHARARGELMPAGAA